MNDENEPKTHIFLKPCGCLSSAYVDVPETYDDLAKAFRYAKRNGLTYKLVETEYVRKMSWHCEAHLGKPKAEQKTMF
jgi:hypothetical protein